MQAKTPEAIRANAMPVTVLPREDHDSRSESIADIKECKQDLLRIASEMRDAQNAMVREWQAYHYIAGTTAALAARASRTPAVPNDLFLRMYHAAKPFCHLAIADVLTSALNFIVSTIKTQRSPRSNLRRWQAVLLPYHSERAWHWAEPQPIRLSSKTAKLERVGGDLHVVLKVCKGKLPIRLKIKSKVATDRILRPDGPGKNGQKYNERIDRLASLPKLNGSMLTLRRGKWFFSFITRHEVPQLPVKDDLLTLFIRASNECGLRLRMRGRTAFLIGHEELADLANVRREQIARRSELKARGVDSRSKKAQQVKHRWENYCKTLYQKTSHQIADWAAENKIERIAFMAGDEWCALGSCGNDDLEKSEPTRFPFAAFATQLQQKCLEYGIVYTSRPNLRSAKRRKQLWRKRIERERL